MKEDYDEETVLSTSSKNLLRPLKKSETYKKEDLIKIHEFKRENIIEPFKEVGEKDFFKFTSEDDPKYNFISIKYFVRSKLLIKAIYWSFGIGCAFFAHRYYRKQLFWPALRWGGMAWTLSMVGVWAGLEFSPHLMAIFHSQFIKDLSMKDQSKYKTIGNTQQEEMINKNYYDQFGVKLKVTNNTNCEIAKLAYDYDSITLQNMRYRPLRTDKIVVKREFTEDDLFSEDFEEKDLAKAMKGQLESEFDYDFSFHNKQQLNENCIINTNKFFELEKKGKRNNIRLKVLKENILSKPGTDVSTYDLLKRELKNAEKYLNGEIKDFESDPDYKLF